LSKVNFRFGNDKTFSNRALAMSNLWTWTNFLSKASAFGQIFCPNHSLDNGLDLLDFLQYGPVCRYFQIEFIVGRLPARLRCLPACCPSARLPARRTPHPARRTPQATRRSSHAAHRCPNSVLSLLLARRPLEPAPSVVPSTLARRTPLIKLSIC
jgi:hypothetical protein